MSKLWSAAALATIGAQASRLPETPVTHWMEMKAAPARVREIMAEANVALAAIEDDSTLTPAGKQQRAAELGKAVIAKLEGATESAEKAADRRIQALNAKLSTVIEKPADPAVAQEIRAHIKNQPSPIMAALALVGDPQTVSALVGAPAFLSGLTDKDIALLKSKVLGTTPHQKEIQEIEGALGVVSAAVKSAKAMVSERAQTRELPTLRPPEPAKAG
jgi:hypothetical protein